MDVVAEEVEEARRAFSLDDEAGEGGGGAEVSMIHRLTDMFGVTLDECRDKIGESVKNEPVCRHQN